MLAVVVLVIIMIRPFPVASFEFFCRLFLYRSLLGLNSRSRILRPLSCLLLIESMDSAAPDTAESSKRPLEDSPSAVPATKRSKPAKEELAPSSSMEETEKLSGGDGVGRGRGKKKRANVGPKDGRRDRRGTRGTRNVETEGSRAEGDDGEKTPRLPKRQCALLIGFCGTGCNGMQMCVDAKPCQENDSSPVVLDSLMYARSRAFYSMPWLRQARYLRTTQMTLLK